MKAVTLIGMVGFLVCGSVSLAQAGSGPTAPTLEEVLHLRKTKFVMFEPNRMAASSSLNAIHIRFGDGSVRPGEQRGVMLVIYNSAPNGSGGHDILMQDFHFLTNTGDALLNFTRFIPGRDAPSSIETDNRVGIIAVLIGLLRDPNTGLFTPASLPQDDTVSVNITDGTVTGLLLPAVQKVRAAASRL